jgi:hypothetical protein
VPAIVVMFQEKNVAKTTLDVIEKHLRITNLWSSDSASSLTRTNSDCAVDPHGSLEARLHNCLDNAQNLDLNKA